MNTRAPLFVLCNRCKRQVGPVGDDGWTLEGWRNVPLNGNLKARVPICPDCLTDADREALVQLDCWRAELALDVEELVIAGNTKDYAIRKVAAKHSVIPWAVMTALRDQDMRHL